MKAFVTVTVAEHGHGSNGTWLLRTRRLLHVAATCLRSSSSVCSCQSNFEESLPWKACPESGWPGLARGRAGQAIIYYRFRAESAAIFFGIFPRPRRRRCQMRGSETGYFFLLGSWQEFCGPLFVLSVWVAPALQPLRLQVKHAARRSAITACSNVLVGNHTSDGHAKIACACDPGSTGRIKLRWSSLSSIQVFKPVCHS